MHNPLRLYIGLYMLVFIVEMVALTRIKVQRLGETPRQRISNRVLFSLVNDHSGRHIVTSTQTGSYSCRIQLHIHDIEQLELIRRCQKDLRICINSCEYRAGYKKYLNSYVVLILSRVSTLFHQTSHLTVTRAFG